MSLFKARVQTGTLILGRCAFITVTYQADYAEAAPAGYVSRDWKAFWRKLRPTPLRVMEWLRVVELTKRGIPHHHLTIGPIPEGMDIRCYGDRFHMGRFRQRFDSCLCLSHRASRAWLAVTGSSEIVHSVPVLPGKNAGGYMGKYMLKNMSGYRGAALGMARRWSTSKGWPGSGQLRLKNHEWSLVQFLPGHKLETEYTNDEGLLEREGTDVAMLAAEQRQRRAGPNKIIERFA